MKNILILLSLIFTFACTKKAGENSGQVLTQEEKTKQHRLQQINKSNPYPTQSRAMTDFILTTIKKNPKIKAAELVDIATKEFVSIGMKFELNSPNGYVVDSKAYLPTKDGMLFQVSDQYMNECSETPIQKVHAGFDDGRGWTVGIECGAEKCNAIKTLDAGPANYGFIRFRHSKINKFRVPVPDLSFQPDGISQDGQYVLIRVPFVSDESRKWWKQNGFQKKGDPYLVLRIGAESVHFSANKSDYEMTAGIKETVDEGPSGLSHHFLKGDHYLFIEKCNPQKPQDTVTTGA